jgi:hypothetical protein
VSRGAKMPHSHENLNLAIYFPTPLKVKVQISIISTFIYATRALYKKR